MRDFSQETLAARLLRRVLLPIYIETDGVITPVGTGAIIAANARQALMLSAAHIFREIIRSDRPSRHAPSMPDILKPPEPYDFQLKRTLIKTIYWSGEGTVMHAVDIPRAYTMRDEYDLALCLLYFAPQADPALTFPNRLGMDTTPLRPGEEVVAVGYTGMEIEQPDKDGKPAPTGWLFQNQLAIRPGVVTNVFHQQHPRGHIGPCCEVTCAIDSGMSGGVLLQQREGSLYLRAVLSSDLSDDAEDIRKGSGSAAVCSMIWPAMSMTIDGLHPDNNSKKQRLLDYERLGTVDDVGKASAHMHITPSTSEGEDLLWI